MSATRDRSTGTEHAPRAVGSGRSANPARGIPEATVARLPVYLRALVALTERGIATCSSEELAAAASSLKGQATVMQESVKVFRLNGG